MIAIDSLSMISIASFLVLWVVTVVAAPKRELDGRGRATLGCLLAGTVLAYAAATLPVFLAGWALTVLPYLLDWNGKRSGPKIALLFSTVLVAVGAVTPAFWPGNTGTTLALVALVIATLLRMGILPFHFWVLDAFASTRLTALSLLLNSHLGAYLLIRFAIPLSPDMATGASPVLSVLAMSTSVFMAFAALAEKRPRRLLGLLCISQSAFLVAGLANQTQQGITGALVQWWVVAFAMTGMICVYGALEARHSGVSAPNGFLGLGAHAPRLAVFFAICGLALVGLPGTLGFVAEDLLFHGALSAHPLLGLALPLATALNAISVLRLFATLFLGRRAIHAVPIPDAQPRETLALAVTVVLLVLGGLMPGILIDLRTPAASALAGVFAGR